ncbi:MAG: hypothetical protein B6D59_03490 [Campylobacteraceae bacterium 4484_4]|nr:MAG: hypothetical protein B6D59_03490 [Campylobacteraceae bacterium 4484_4]
MRFSEFMRSWLYGPQGYYATHPVIGKKGDFYTAVSSSMFFGGSIANRLIRVIDEGFLRPDTTVLEIGAHQGYMMADMIQFIYTLRPELLQSLKFAIIEPQSENIRVQLAYFKEAFGDAVKLRHFTSLEEVRLKEAFVVANELFDAFACEVVKKEQMLYIEGFTPVFGEKEKKIAQIAQRYEIERGEIALGYEAFAASMADAIGKFEFVTFDYGETHPRNDFSLRIYHKHHVYPFFALTPFVTDEEEKPEGVSLQSLFRKSDITYDVHFTHLMDAFLEAGIETVMYKTQLAMLVDFGIIDLLEILRKNASDEAYQSEMNRAKLLIDPAFMGERFKGVVFRKEGKWE